MDHNLQPKPDRTIQPGPMYPDLFDGATPIMIPGEAVCLSCHCTDSRACLGVYGDPCSWVEVDYEMGIGICSECSHDLWLYHGVMGQDNRRARCRQHGNELKELIDIPESDLLLFVCYSCCFRL